MKNWLHLTFYFIETLIKLSRPGGLKAVAAENVALRQQLILVAKNKKRSPKLTLSNRIIFGLLAAWIKPRRLGKVAIIVKPATLLKFHKALVKCKYRLLYSNKSPKKPGPKGPCQEVINLIIEMKQRNPYFACRRIAMQISNVFDVEMDKDIVRRVLAKYYQPIGNSDGPSWLTFIGHMKYSLWSIDLFRSESISLQSHWVMVIMDQFTRKIIGFATHKGDLHGVAICCMFNKIISNKTPPQYLSSDNDPLFKFHRWRANLRILDIDTLKGTGEIETIPYAPKSHPFVERLIQIYRNELSDRSLFWTGADLQCKLDCFQRYFNEHRTHMGLQGDIPNQVAENKKPNVIDIKNYRWKSHCRGLFNLPIAA